MSTQISTKIKEKISFILYEDGKIPRYHQFRPRVYKSLVYAPTVLTLISTFVLIGSYFYTKNIETFIRSNEPEIIKELRTENILLKEKSQELSFLNEQLTTKISSGVPKTPMGALDIMQPVFGQKDMTSPVTINIQDIKPVQSGDKIFFNFNIVNVTPNGTKLAGYIHIFATDGNTYSHYPQETGVVENYALNYTSGESFATSRFRPVEASFAKLDKSSIIFKIIIFNRVGDLIHQQQFKHSFE